MTEEGYRCCFGLCPAEIGAAVLAALLIFLQLGGYFQFQVQPFDYRWVTIAVIVLSFLVILGTVLRKSILYWPPLIINLVAIAYNVLGIVMITMASFEHGPPSGDELKKYSIHLGFLLLMVFLQTWLEMIIWTAHAYVSRFHD